MESNSRFVFLLQKWNAIPDITYLYKNGICMVSRLILKEATIALTQFRALCITGPRQSGKTTLSKMLFKGKPYVNFENPNVQAEAEQNPVAFLKKYKAGAVFDEVQRVPIIFRYLQEILDKNTKRGQYILTGSNNFLLQEQVSQSLAGRAGYLSLLPLSYAEIKQAKLPCQDVNQLILTGGYPEIWQEKLIPNTWLNSYVQTYVQRDVRLIKNINNLATFTRFIHLCANYAGQVLNRDELAMQTGVDTKTILAWLGLLENSYIIYLVQPWHNNYNKRLVKSPKLYFYDTGVLCYLLGLKSISALQKHNAYGSIFENWIITEMKKNNFNAGNGKNLYYFRDSLGNEVDCITENENSVLAIEIKSGKKYDSNMMHGLKYWNKLQPASNSVLLYGGNKEYAYAENIHAMPWHEVANI